MKFPPLIFAAILILIAPLVRADGLASAAPAVPAAGFPAARYETLWTKSPFAVATSETVGEESPDYFLVGIANLEGISYASVIERQNQEHFLISTDKANRGLTLKSINRSQDGAGTFAEVLKDGQTLTLKLEQPPAGVPGVPGVGMNPGMIGMPGSMTPNIQMPGATSSFPNNGSVRPFTRFHRPPIHLPPMPAPQQQAAPTPPPPQQ
jgi:hypothetical protein